MEENIDKQNANVKKTKKKEKNYSIKQLEKINICRRKYMSGIF